MRASHLAAYRAALGGAIVSMLACVPNERRDAHCTPDEGSIDASGDCIYAGDGKGPAFHEDACAPPEGPKPATCPNFDQIVFLFNDASRGNCTSGACHGRPDSAAVGIYFDPTDARSFYTSLTSATGSVGTPYVVPDDPATPDNEALTSWVQCNVRGEPGGGFPMPVWSGLPDPADAELVDDWILCGAPGPP
jgi:hypothetical protein